MSYPNVLEEIEIIKSTYKPSNVVFSNIIGNINKSDNLGRLILRGGTGWGDGSLIILGGNGDDEAYAGKCIIYSFSEDGSNSSISFSHTNGLIINGDKCVINPTGSIISSSSMVLTGNTNTVGRHICSGTTWSKGAFIRLDGCEVEETSNYIKGQFIIGAHDGTTRRLLCGKPDNTLTWDGKIIDTIYASGTNYIRYTNGIQICWVKLSHKSSSTTSNYDSSGSVYYSTATWTFPVAFVSEPCVSSTPLDSLTGLPTSSPSSVSKTATVIQSCSKSAGATYTYNIAIGRWK